MRRLLPTAASVLCAASLLAGSPAAAASDAEVAGSVKLVQGTAAVVRAGQSLPATPGLRLRAGDALETGPDGRLGVVLRDDSLVSIGPSSRLQIERFAFDPAQGRFALALQALRGTMAYLSGLIVRLAPEAATVTTPVTTIGIRGTRFAVRVAD